MKEIANKDIVKFAVLSLLAAVLLASGHYFNLQEYFTLEKTRRMIENAGPWRFIIFAASYLVSSLMPFPATLLSTVSGALWGEYLGTAITIVSATVACCVPFMISRLLGRGLIGTIIQKNHTAHSCDRFASKNGFAAVLVMRLTPIFPWDVVNYVAGLCGIRFRDYFLASLIGTIPASFTYNLIGSSLGEPVEKTRIILLIILVLIIALTVILTKRKRVDAIDKTGNAGRQIMAEYKRVEISPMDKFNTELIENVHPADWSNPVPAKKYNLVVIGAGTAGLVTAAGAAALGAKVALIERNLLGGDCLNVGCVPSKSFIRSSRAMAEIVNATRYGILSADSAAVDFASVMQRVRAIRAKISHHDSAKRFRDLGVDVFFGQAEFSSTDTVTVGGKTLRFRKAVIATGARAVTPDVEGLKEAGFLTNETVFNLTQQPKRLAVIGGGPIGCELAQAFARLGTQVTMFHRDEHILNREDADAAGIVQDRFKQEGIQLILGCAPTRVEMRAQEKVVHYVCEGKELAVVVDAILAGAGRAPNVDALNLDLVGIQYDKREGVKVNDHLQTRNPRIYAAGDICMKWKFTHAADAAARIVIQNALFFGRKKLSALTMPWCTYTNPEIAHVGLYEKEARTSGIEVDTYKVEWRDVDRAVADGEKEGFIKLLVRKGSDRIVGATVVAAHAGEMISEISVAMAGKVGLRALSQVIHPYPTQAEAIKKAADIFNRTRLTPAVEKLLLRWLAWQRK